MVTTANPMSIPEIAVEQFAQDVWGYCRTYKNSLDSQKHTDWIVARSEKFLEQCSTRTDKLEKRIQVLEWIMRCNESGCRIHRKNQSPTSDRNRQYDQDIIHAITKLDATLSQVARAYQSSTTTIRGILREHGYIIEE